MKGDVNPLSSSWEAGLAAMCRAPRCAAQSKRAGLPCKAPAASGWRVSSTMAQPGGTRPARPIPPGSTGPGPEAPSSCGVW